ncbi:leukocyte receptor cluster member 1-like [Amblyraja radiata]|uniref:leukocyte receptor cluster member 1-like n=1 Tax=Amblyraja radiata TaxID=386614 RepID=UPI0014032433|nr:leukocyte receptor cluster member 1-like [Amblyraja radiata]
MFWKPGTLTYRGWKTLHMTEQNGKSFLTNALNSENSENVEKQTSRVARTEFLRKRARLSLPDAPAAEVSTRSLNLFSDGEGDEGRMGGSKEYEEEKRQEKERRERSLGILTYLGQSVWESQTAGPWYARVPEHGTEAEAEKGRKRRMDPLRNMREWLRGGGGKSGGGGGGREGGWRRGGVVSLREERLRREEAERKRAEALLRGVEGQREGEGRKEGEGQREGEGNSRAYNSQFHPELSRRYNKRHR